MKTKKYAMLTVVLLTSVLTMCFAGRAIPKTLRLERDDKTDAAYQEAISKSRKWIRDTLERWNSGGEMGEAEVVALLSLYSEKTKEQRDTLKGLNGVCVIVESLIPDAEQHGLTKEALQTAVELRLRQHGIKVNPVGPVLFISVSAAANEEFSISAVAVWVGFVQPAVLLRNPKTLTAVTTWQKYNVGLFGLDKLRTFRETVQDNVDEFINDYLAANPKKQPLEEPKKPIDFTPIEKKDKTPKDD